METKKGISFIKVINNKSKLFQTAWNEKKERNEKIVVPYGNYDRVKLGLYSRVRTNGKVERERIKPELKLGGFFR